MDLFKPKAGAPLNPLATNQQNGQITNPPRYSMLGGLDKGSKAGHKNKMDIVPPGDGRKVI